MAEMIPLEYRVSVARKSLIGRWITVGVLAVATAAAGVTYTYMWRKKQSDELTKTQAQYVISTALLKASRDVQASRDVLANKMIHMEQLQNDTLLLSLLKNVSLSFSDDDCVKFIRVDAHLADQKPDDTRYQVRMYGITRDDTTHSKLLDRLTEMGKTAQPPLKLNLGEKHKTPILDGEATFFDLTCDTPSITATAKGN